MIKLIFLSSSNKVQTLSDLIQEALRVAKNCSYVSVIIFNIIYGLTFFIIIFMNYVLTHLFILCLKFFTIYHDYTFSPGKTGRKQLSNLEAPKLFLTSSQENNRYYPITGLKDIDNQWPQYPPKPNNPQALDSPLYLLGQLIGEQTSVLQLLSDKQLDQLSFISYIIHATQEHYQKDHNVVAFGLSPQQLTDYVTELIEVFLQSVAVDYTHLNHNDNNDLRSKIFHNLRQYLIYNYCFLIILSIYDKEKYYQNFLIEIMYVQLNTIIVEFLSEDQIITQITQQDPSIINIKRNYLNDYLFNAVNALGKKKDLKNLSTQHLSVINLEMLNNIQENICTIDLSHRKENELQEIQNNNATNIKSREKILDQFVQLNQLIAPSSIEIAQKHQAINDAFNRDDLNIRSLVNVYKYLNKQDNIDRDHVFERENINSSLSNSKCYLDLSQPDKDTLNQQLNELSTNMISYRNTGSSSQNNIPYESIQLNDYNINKIYSIFINELMKKFQENKNMFTELCSQNVQNVQNACYDEHFTNILEQYVNYVSNPQNPETFCTYTKNLLELNQNKKQHLQTLVDLFIKPHVFTSSTVYSYPEVIYNIGKFLLNKIKLDKNIFINVFNQQLCVILNDISKSIINEDNKQWLKDLQNALDIINTNSVILIMIKRFKESHNTREINLVYVIIDFYARFFHQDNKIVSELAKAIETEQKLECNNKRAQETAINKTIHIIIGQINMILTQAVTQYVQKTYNIQLKIDSNNISKLQVTIKKDIIEKLKAKNTDNIIQCCQKILKLDHEYPKDYDQLCELYWHIKQFIQGTIEIYKKNIIALNKCQNILQIFGVNGLLGDYFNNYLQFEKGVVPISIIYDEKLVPFKILKSLDQNCQFSNSLNDYQIPSQNLFRDVTMSVMHLESFLEPGKNQNKISENVKHSLLNKIADLQYQNIKDEIFTPMNNKINFKQSLKNNLTTMDIINNLSKQQASFGLQRKIFAQSVLNKLSQFLQNVLSLEIFDIYHNLEQYVENFFGTDVPREILVQLCNRLNGIHNNNVIDAKATLLTVIKDDTHFLEQYIFYAIMLFDQLYQQYYIPGVLLPSYTNIQDQKHFKLWVLECYLIIKNCDLSKNIQQLQSANLPLDLPNPQHKEDNSYILSDEVIREVNNTITCYSLDDLNQLAQVKHHRNPAIHRVYQLCLFLSNLNNKIVVADNFIAEKNVKYQKFHELTSNLYRAHNSTIKRVEHEQAQINFLISFIGTIISICLCLLLVQFIPENVGSLYFNIHNQILKIVLNRINFNAQNSISVDYLPFLIKNYIKSFFVVQTLNIKFVFNILNPILFTMIMHFIINYNYYKRDPILEQSCTFSELSQVEKDQLKNIPLTVPCFFQQKEFFVLLLIYLFISVAITMYQVHINKKYKTNLFVENMLTMKKAQIATLEDSSYTVKQHQQIKIKHKARYKIMNHILKLSTILFILFCNNCNVISFPKLKNKQYVLSFIVIIDLKRNLRYIRESFFMLLTLLNDIIMVIPILLSQNRSQISWSRFLYKMLCNPNIKDFYLLIVFLISFFTMLGILWPILFKDSNKTEMELALCYQDLLVTKEILNQVSLNVNVSEFIQLGKNNRITKIRLSNRDAQNIQHKVYIGKKDMHQNQYLSTNLLYKDLNISLEEGKNYLIIGGNGSGKTTLFNIVNDSINCLDEKNNIFKTCYIELQNAKNENSIIPIQYLYNQLPILFMNQMKINDDRALSQTSDLYYQILFINLCNINNLQVQWSSLSRFISHFSGGEKQKIQNTKMSLKLVRLFNNSYSSFCIPKSFVSYSNLLINQLNNYYNIHQAYYNRLLNYQQNTLNKLVKWIFLDEADKGLSNDDLNLFQTTIFQILPMLNITLQIMSTHFLALNINAYDHRIDLIANICNNFNQIIEEDFKFSANINIQPMSIVLISHHSLNYQSIPHLQLICLHDYKVWIDSLKNLPDILKVIFNIIPDKDIKNPKKITKDPANILSDIKSNSLNDHNNNVLPVDQNQPVVIVL